MDINDFLRNVALGPGTGVNPERTADIVKELGGQAMESYDLYKALAAKTDSRLVNKGKSFYLERQGQLIALPTFHEGTNVFSIEGATYGGVSRFRGGKVTSAFDSFKQRVGARVEQDEPLTFRQVRRYLGKWRQQRGEYLGPRAGGAGAFWTEHKVLARLEDLDPRIQEAVQQLNEIESGMLNQSRVMKRAGGTSTPAITEALEAARAKREEIAQLAMDIHGLYPSVKGFAIRPKGSKDGVRQLTFSSVSPVHRALDPFSRRYAKGSQQTKSLVPFYLPPREGVPVTPALADPMFLRRARYVAGYQERIAGMSSNMTMTAGGRTFGYHPLEQRVKVGTISAIKGASAETRLLIAAQGEAAAFTASGFGNHMVAAGQDASGLRRVMLEAGRTGHGSGTARLHPLLADIAQRNPGNISGISITRAEMDAYARSQFISSYAASNGGRNPSKKAIKAYMASAGRNRYAIGQSVLEDGTMGRVSYLPEGYAITGVDVSQGRVYANMTRMGRAVEGSRILLGSTRFTVAANNAGVDWGGLDFLVRGSDLPPEHTMLSNLAAKISQIKDPTKRGSLQQMLAKAVGGSVNDVTLNYGDKSWTEQVITFGRSFNPDNGGAVLDSFIGDVQSKYGKTYAKALTDNLISPVGDSLTYEQARSYAQSVKHFPTTEQGMKDLDRAARLLMSEARISVQNTTLANRAAQPGFRSGRGAVRMTYLNTVNAFEKVFSMKNFDIDARRAALQGTLTGTSPLSQAALDVWSTLTTPSSRRGQAMMGAFNEMQIQTKFGDDALAAHLARQGRKPITRAEYAAKYKDLINEAPEARHWNNAELAGTPLDPKNTNLTWVDMGENVAARQGGKYQRVSRYVAVMPGAALGREGGLLRESGRRGARGIVSSTVGIHNALASGTLEAPEIAELYGKTMQHFGAMMGGKTGAVNRGFAAGMQHQMSGALLPMPAMAPGEVGISEQTAREMGLSRKMIARMKKHGVAGFRLTHPAFSQSHFETQNIRVLGDRMLSNMNRAPGPFNGIYINPFDVASIERDFDADRAQLMFDSRLAKQMRILHASSGAAGRSAHARSVVEGLVTSEGGDEFRTALMRFSEFDALKAPGGSGIAAAAAAQSVPQAATGYGHTVAFGFHNIVSDVSRGTGLDSMGRIRAGMDPTKVGAVFSEMESMLKSPKAAKLLEASNRAASTFVYAWLKKGSQESQLAGDFLGNILMNPQIGEEGIDRAAASLRQLMSSLTNSNWKPDIEVTDDVVRDVAKLWTNASYLASAGLRPTAFGVRGSGDDIIGQLNAIARGFGKSVTTPEVTGANFVEMGKAAQDETLEAVKRLGNGVKEKNAFWGDTARNLASKFSKFVGENKWAKWGLAGAGIFVASKALLGGNNPTPPPTFVGGGAPLPPPPMVGDAISEPDRDFRVMNYGAVSVQRPFNVRTHPQIEGSSTERNMDLTMLAGGAYGTPVGLTHNSGYIEDRTSGARSRQEIERMINRQLNSAF